MKKLKNIPILNSKYYPLIKEISACSRKDWRLQKYNYHTEMVFEERKTYYVRLPLVQNIPCFKHPYF